MLDDRLLQWRRQRLKALRELPDFGSQGALAKALGQADGSYVGQMERGQRAITEKTIAQIEGLRGGKCRGWFAAPGTPRPLTDRALEIAALFDQIEPSLQAHVEALVHALQPIAGARPSAEPSPAPAGSRETPV